MPSPADPIRVLVIDDDRFHAETVAESLQRVGYDCAVATSGEEGSARLDDDEFDVILTDLRMSDIDGLNILRKAREKQPDAEVVMITGFGDVKTAVEAIKQGASNYLTKPVDRDELRAIVQKAADKTRLTRTNRELTKRLDEKYGFSGLVGNSPAMMDVVKKLHSVVEGDARVLLLGETGTGKDLIAKALHNNGPRKNKPFVPFSCAAPNASLIEDDLFGHEAGSYTGGDRLRKGIFEAGNGGTVFLDEIGDMPFPLQAKLLRVLENREVTRIGSNTQIPVNNRIISATHRDLNAMAAAGTFRADLLQRLKVVTLRLPALRERREDIPLLAAQFMKAANAEHGKNAKSIAEPVRRAMNAYGWPGNVRELRNFVDSMVVYDTDGVLGADDAAATESEVMAGATPTAVVTTAAAGGPNLVGRPMDEVERYYYEEALRLAGGNREEAAKMLGVGERTLYRKIQAWREQERPRPSGEGSE